MTSPLGTNVSLDDPEQEEEQLARKLEDCRLQDTSEMNDLPGCRGDDDNDDDDFYSDLPRALIITGVPQSVFEEDDVKDEFESLFKEFESVPQFFYVRAFRRARVAFELSRSATRARICLHEKDFHGSTIKCYFAQATETDSPSSPGSSLFLMPPKPEKQFLISPPCSPPEGWESVNEKEPTINYDLIAAITNLAAGESHEIHAASESVPGIVVHVCEDPEGFKNRPQILQTRCPHSI